MQDERLTRIEEILAGLELTDPPKRQVSPPPLYYKPILISSLSTAVLAAILAALLQSQTT
jgi:hypothetical protein